MKSKILIIGGTGGLGHSVSEYLNSMDYDVEAVGSAKCNLLKEDCFDDFMSYRQIVYMPAINSDSLLAKIDMKNVLDQVQVNSFGFVKCLAAFLPLMKEDQFGRFIYLSSVLSAKPIPGTGIYSATKAFSDSIVKTCALENAKYGITCNSIQLGYFDGGLTNKVPQNILDIVIKSNPTKRLGRKVELGSMIDFILKSDYLNGSMLSLDGGQALV